MDRIHSWRTLNCTTDKLAQHLNDLAKTNQLIWDIVHTGGRDWVIITYQESRS